MTRYRRKGKNVYVLFISGEVTFMRRLRPIDYTVITGACKRFTHSEMVTSP